MAQIHQTPLARYTQLIADYGMTSMMHSCGLVWAVLPDLIDIGLNGLSVFQTVTAGMNAAEIARHFGGKMVFYGGIDSNRLLVSGSTRQVRDEVQANFAAFAQCGGYIAANSHHGIANAKPENLIAISEAGTSAAIPLPYRLENEIMIKGLDIGVFCAYFAVLAILGYIASRKEKNTKRDYFLAGDKLPWWMVGGSIVAANISSQHFIGGMGTAYARGFVVLVMEWAAVLIGFNALLWVFLPFYLRNGFYTMPEFLQKRFGTASRHLCRAYHYHLCFCGNQRLALIWEPSLWMGYSVYR